MNLGNLPLNLAVSKRFHLLERTSNPANSGFEPQVSHQTNCHVPQKTLFFHVFPYIFVPNCHVFFAPARRVDGFQWPSWPSEPSWLPASRPGSMAFPQWRGKSTGNCKIIGPPHSHLEVVYVGFSEKVCEKK